MTKKAGGDGRQGRRRDELELIASWVCFVSAQRNTKIAIFCLPTIFGYLIITTLKLLPWYTGTFLAMGEFYLMHHVRSSLLDSFPSSLPWFFSRFGFYLELKLICACSRFRRRSSPESCSTTKEQETPSPNPLTSLPSSSPVWFGSDRLGQRDWFIVSIALLSHASNSFFILSLLLLPVFLRRVASRPDLVLFRSFETQTPPATHSTTFSSSSPTSSQSTTSFVLLLSMLGRRRNRGVMLS